MSKEPEKPDLKRIVLEPGKHGLNWTILEVIEKLRYPIRRSRAWTAARLIENSPICQDAMIVPDENIQQLALQLCIVQQQIVDKVERELRGLKLPDTDTWSDTMQAHDRMVKRVR